MEAQIVHYSAKKKAGKKKVKFSDTFPSSNLFKWKVSSLYTHINVIAREYSKMYESLPIPLREQFRSINVRETREFQQAVDL